MNTRKWIIVSGITVLVLLAMLVLAAGLTRAQEPEPETGTDSSGASGAEAAEVANIIPIQGRLTDAGGNPIDGSRTITFTLYDQSWGGTVMCRDDDYVSVDDGLFTAFLNFCAPSDIDGRQLYLGIQVEGDEEMTPRRQIYPVPYAFSLLPGAVISDTAGGHILRLRNGGSGTGLRSYSHSGTGVDASSYSGDGVVASTLSGDGVVASSVGGDGVAGYSMSGSGVVGSSGSGAAIAARGNGVITSTAKSYVWVSGNDLRKKYSADTTEFECDLYGGVLVRRGADTGNKDVMLPVTLPGQLYGQDVTLTGIDVYFQSETDFDTIDLTIVRRQTGAGSGDVIRSDGTDRVCTTACSYHLDLTSNNVLDDQHGVVYIAFRLQFSGASTYVRIGGVRLTLEHD
jgi:hypothetical protein